MKVAFGAAVAVTGASALIYILLRSRKRHPDPGKEDNAGTSSEIINPNKTDVNASLSDKSSTICNDDTSVKSCPYVNFNGHVPVDGKSSEEILEGHVIDHSNEREGNYQVKQNTEICEEPVTTVEVEQSTSDTSGQHLKTAESSICSSDKFVSVAGLLDDFERNYTDGKNDDLVNIKKGRDGHFLENKENGMECISLVSAESVSVAENLKEIENSLVSMNGEENVICSSTVSDMLSAKPVPLGMEVTCTTFETTEDAESSSLIIQQEKEASQYSCLENDYHTMAVVIEEEKEPMRSSNVSSVSLEKSVLSTVCMNESNGMFDTQEHELGTSLKPQGKEPSVLPSLGKDGVLTESCGFVLEEESPISSSKDRNQEPVTHTSLDLNREYSDSSDLAQINSLCSSILVEDEKSDESLVVCKEEESFLSSCLEHEKQSTLSFSMDDAKQSIMSPNLEQEEQLTNFLAKEEIALSCDMGQEECVTLSHNIEVEKDIAPAWNLDHDERSPHSSCIDKKSLPIISQEEGSALSSSRDIGEQSTILFSLEEPSTISSTVLLEQQLSPSSFDEKECCNLSSSMATTERNAVLSTLGSENQSTLSFSSDQEQSPLSLNLIPKEKSTPILDQEDRLTHSSNIDQVEQLTISSNVSQEEQSSLLSNIVLEELDSCSSSNGLEEHPHLSSSVDQEELVLSFTSAHAEEAVSEDQEAQEESLRLAKEGGSTYLNKKERAVLSTSLSEKKQTAVSLKMDQENKSSISCTFDQEEQLDVLSSSDKEKQITVSSVLAQREQSVVLPSLASEEQPALSTSLNEDQESEKLCTQSLATSKDKCIKAMKTKMEDCQKNSAPQKKEDGSASDCLVKEGVTSSSNNGFTEQQQKTSKEDEEIEMANKTQNVDLEISILREGSSIETSRLREECSASTKMMMGSSTETSKLKATCSKEGSKLRGRDSTGISLTKENSAGVGSLKEISSTDIVNSKESNITSIHKQKENSDAGISNVREDSNRVKKAGVSDKGTFRREQFQDNQGDSAAADLDDDPAAEQDNVNSDSLSLKSLDSGKDSTEVEPETLFNPSTFPVSSQEQYIFYEFEIPQTLVGRLIGRKGAFVNRIKATTEATVIVYPHENVRLKLCSVEGTKQQVIAALNMIREHFPQSRYADLTLAQVFTQQSLLTQTRPTLNTQAMQIELTAGVVVEVRVSAVVTAGELWVQQPLHPSYSALHRLQSCMNLNYGDGSNTPPLPSPIQDGIVCVAQIKKHWLRCQLQSTEDDVSSVVLLDVGGTVSVATSLLRQIRYDYMTLPFQATQCFLHGVQPAKGDVWDDASTAVMEEFVSDTILFATVVSYTEDGVPLVNIYRRDQDEYVHLNEKLVRLGHARWLSPQPAS